MQKKRLMQVVGVASGALLLTTALKRRQTGATRNRETDESRPADSPALVWVNTEGGVYHQPGTRWYGRTASGEYMSEADARSAGHKPASRSAARKRRTKSTA